MKSLKNTTKTFVALAALSLALPAQAAVIVQSIDFGSDPGKNGDGGFTQTATGGVWSVQPDSLRYARPPSVTGNQNAFALREFDNLQDESFQVTSEITLFDRPAAASGNTDKFGVILFATSTTTTSTADGIGLTFTNFNGLAGAAQIRITSGITGTTAAFAVWNGSVAAGTKYFFTGDVINGAGTTFDVMFTLSDGTNSQNITATFDKSSVLSTSDSFGFSSRIANNNMVLDYDTFAIVPEPSSSLLLLGGLGVLALRRRR